MLSDFYQADPLPARTIAEELVVLAQFLAPLVVNPYKVLRGVREGTESALFEGAQGTMLDIDHGTFPYVTSSNSTIGGALTGTGLPPRALGEINGVFKAYCTRVGNGPFPTELLGELGDGLREAGGEYGATTGRARRCGWFDLVAGRYAVDINGMTGVIITKLDVLDNQPTIRVATAYEVDGQPLDTYPAHERGHGALPARLPRFPGLGEADRRLPPPDRPAGRGAQVPGVPGGRAGDADRRGQRGPRTRADDLDRHRRDHLTAPFDTPCGVAYIAGPRRRRRLETVGR